MTMKTNGKKYQRNTHMREREGLDHFTFLPSMIEANPLNCNWEMGVKEDKTERQKDAKNAL